MDKSNAIQKKAPLVVDEAIMQKNRGKFQAVRELNLPMAHYAITGSGALGIRGLRRIGDIDLIVSLQLWDILALKHGIVDDGKISKIVFPGGLVEAFTQCSFYTESIDLDAPTLLRRLERADIIEGLPFESLQHLLYYKQKMGRAKDLSDIELIKKVARSEN